MATTNTQMSLQDAIGMMDKTFTRSRVKIEEIMEDLGGLQQMLPQVVQFYEQKLLENKKVTEELNIQKNDAVKYVEDLIRILHEHNLGIPDPPEFLKKQEEPVKLT